MLRPTEKFTDSCLKETAELPIVFARGTPLLAHRIRVLSVDILRTFSWVFLLFSLIARSLDRFPITEWFLLRVQFRLSFLVMATKHGIEAYQAQP
jgi:hypothetical protein